MTSVELFDALSGADWPKLAALDGPDVREYVRSVLEDESVLQFYVNDDGGLYSDFHFDLQVLVLTDTLVFEFLFASKFKRYDITYVRDIFRIEERTEEEDVVDGPPRKKVTLRIDFREANVTLITQYSAKARQLISFGDNLRKSVFVRSS